MRPLAFNFLVFILVPSAALAQAPAAPQSVNDCTLLTDPTELRACILRFEGARQIPGVVAPPPAQPSTEENPEAGPAAPVARPREATLPRAPIPEGKRPAPTRRDPAAEVMIEQIQQPPSYGERRARPHRKRSSLAKPRPNKAKQRPR